MASLTDWEKQHIDSMHLLLDQAAGVIEYFKRNEQELSDKAVSVERDLDTEQLNFRLIVFNLYSVLDYTYYLLYCHFSNKGQPDLSSKSMQCGFPFKAKGVKVSTTPSQDQSRKFVEEKLKFLWGTKIGKNTHMWKDLGEILLAVQPKLTVDAGGQCPDQPQVSLGDEESFSLLHFYRNCCTHRGLLSFEAKDMIFEIDQATRVLTVAAEQSNREGVFSFDIPKTAYWIKLPPHVVAHRAPNEQIPRMLVDVLQQLFSFTKQVSSKLLFSTFLIPRPADVLKSHFGDEVDIHVEVKPIDAMQNVTVGATIDCNGDKQTLVESSRHKDKSDASDEACSCLIATLASKCVYPDRPYRYMYSTTHQFKPHPPIIKLQDSTKNGRVILNEFRQAIENKKLDCSLSDNKPVQSQEDCQRYQASRSVEVSSGGESLVTVESGPCIGIGKDRASQEAAKKVVDELAHLGFLQFNK